MISKEEIEHLAELSRLKLDDKEIADLQKDFDAILEYVGKVQLGRSDLPKGENQDRTLESPERRSDLGFPELRNVMREDEPRAADDLLAGKDGAIRAAAPEREGEYFAVRKIIDREP